MDQNAPGLKVKFLSWDFFLVLSLFGGTALRVVSLLRESAVGDELFCRKLALLPWKESMQAVLKDIVTPPVHYMSFKAWSAMAGKGLFELRVAALFFGIAVITGTFLLGKFIFRDTKIAAIAGILVAGNDLQILFSHFARHYTMYSVFVLALLALFWHALQKPRSWPVWLAFTGIGTILVYTHYIGWLYLFSFFPLVLTKPFRRLLRGFLISGTVTALLFLPWLLAVAPHYRNRGGLDVNLAWVKTPSFQDFPELFARFSGLPGISGYLLFFSAVGIFIVVIYGLVSGGKSVMAGFNPASRAIWLLAGVAVIPPCVLFLLSRPPLELPIWGFRHLMPSQAPWTLLTALAIISISRQTRRAVAFFLIAATVSFQWLPSFQSTLRLRFPPISKVTAYLKEAGRGRERIFTFSPRYRQVLNFHLDAHRAVKTLPKNIFKLPVSFWIVYNPRLEKERENMIRLERLGYSAEKSQSFSHLKYFHKHQDDIWELRAAFLSRINRHDPDRKD